VLQKACEGTLRLTEKRPRAGSQLAGAGLGRAPCVQYLRVSGAQWLWGWEVYVIIETAHLGSLLVPSPSRKPLGDGACLGRERVQKGIE
jgi:hypothetical protein